MGNSILIVEDSSDYALMLHSILGKRYSVTISKTGSEALSLLSQQTFNLAIIDIILPDMSGLQICNFIKSQENLREMPVIILTSNDSIDDKVEGLEVGANDYITKPFDFRELEARVKNQLRKQEAPRKTMSLSSLEIDLDKQSVFSTTLQKNIEMTRIEFKLLICFAQRIDHILSRSQLLDIVWPENLNISERTIDSHISNLRKKIKENGIELTAVHGSGYRLSLCQTAA